MYYNFLEKENGFYTTRCEINKFEHTPKLVGIKLVNQKVIKDYEFPSMEDIVSGKIFTSIEEIYEDTLNVVDLSEPDCAKWMIDATFSETYNRIMTTQANKNKLLILSDTNDGFIPGVFVEDLKFKSMTGSEVAQNKNAILVTPYGNVNVPVPGKKTIIFKNILAWSGIPRAFIKQWIGTLVKFKQLSKNLKESVLFPISGTSKEYFFTGPLFIEHYPEKKRFVNFVDLKISSESPQKIKINYRDINDYTNVLGSINVNCKSGQNEFKLKIRSLKLVPSMVVEIQPNDSIAASLDYYDVKVRL